MCIYSRPLTCCYSSLLSFVLKDLVHLTSSSSGSAYEDLAPVVSRLFHIPCAPSEGSSQGLIFSFRFNKDKAEVVCIILAHLIYSSCFGPALDNKAFLSEFNENIIV